MSHSRKNLFLFITLLIILISLPLTVYLARQRQIIEKRAAVGGIPYGPLWFGQNPAADYSNAEALEAFSGTTLALSYSSDPEGILRAAQDHGLKVTAAIGGSNPCDFWNSVTFTFDYEAFMQTVRPHIPLVAQYYPETVIAALMLNEPFWMNHPTATCFSGVPPKILYNLVKQVRGEFAANGLTDPNFLLGVNAYPGYMENPLNQPGYIEPPGGGQMTEAEKRDGTINFLSMQYNGSAIVDFDAYFSEGKGLMREWGVKAGYIAILAGNSLPAINTWMCQQDDAAHVGYWQWGNQTVPISSLIPVREVCEGNVIATPTPGPTIPPFPTPTPGGPTPTPIEHCLPLGDIDCSGKVNSLDFSYLIAHYDTSDPKADLDDSGKVNALDVSVLLANFGKE